jgi:hypothetical protein
LIPIDGKDNNKNIIQKNLITSIEAKPDVKIPFHQAYKNIWLLYKQ